MNHSGKLKAIELRKNGWSYKDISERILIPKSTLSTWLHDVPYAPNKTVKNRIKKGPQKSALIRSTQKANSFITAQDMALSEIGQLTKKELYLIGIALYLGEGSKTNEQVRITNSDPIVIQLAMDWFRKTLYLKNENFALRIHGHPDTNEKEAIQFWSDITGLNESYFHKTIIDTREKTQKKHRYKSGYGTLHITIKSCGNKQFGVLLHRRIMAGIQEISRQAGIA